MGGHGRPCGRLCEAMRGQIGRLKCEAKVGGQSGRPKWETKVGGCERPNWEAM